MKAVAYRLRCVLRARWRATLGMTAIVVVVGAVVLALAAGAQRTSSAPDRYAKARGPAVDGILIQERGLPRTDEVAALSGAESVESATFVFGGLARPEHPDELLDAIAFGGAYTATGSRLVSGRDANPAVRGEFVATKSFVDAYDVAIGEAFTFGSLTQEQADRAGFAAGDPEGPSFEAILVGVIDGPADFDDPSTRAEPMVVFPASLFDEPEIGVASTIMTVRLRPEVDVEAFRAELDTLPDSDAFILQPGVLVGATVRTAVEAQGRALWLLAAVSAVAAVAVLGQLITRQVRLSVAERSRLSSIGFTHAQIVSESVGRAAVPIVGGTVLAVGIAAMASNAFPTGFVRRMEPSPGLRFETVTLIVGGLAFMAALLAWAVIALASTRSRSRAARPSTVIERFATNSPSVTAATGLRFAFMRGERDVGSVRTSLGGLLLAVVGVVGALTFASSLERLVSDRDRYGYSYDVTFGSGQTTVSDELREGLDGDPDVAAMMLYSEAQARVGSTSLQLIGMEPVRGDIGPTVLTGRLPASEDEIALGRLAAHSFGVGVGDELTLEGIDSTRVFRVTGLAVVPSIGSNEGVGQDGVVTIGALQKLDQSVVSNTAVIDIRKGAPSGTKERITTDYGAADIGEEAPPTVIQNLARVRAIPYLLAGLLGALAILTVAHVMLTSIHNRRRDVAVVRSLGADRGWITRAVHWQATSFILLPIVIGAPVGLILGQVVFRSFADSVGAVDGASLPFVNIAAIVAALVLLANAVAAVPARRARRLAPARLLQAE